MSAVSQSALPDIHVVLRSILPGRGPMRVPDYRRRRSPGHFSVALEFVMHMAMTSFVFTSFVTLVWGVAWVFSLLQATKPFAEDALQVVEMLEGVLIRVDAVACGIVLFYGIGRYILNVIKGDS